MKYLLIATIFLAGIMGCMNDEPAAPTPPDQPEPAEPASPDDPGVTDPGAARMLQSVRQDLGRRIEVPPAEIEVVEVEPVMWPDASLGCPQPGHMYAQVVTPGYRIVLRANQQTYRYHTDRDRNFVLCDQNE